MPFEAETLLARAVKEEVAKLALQRQATAETLAKYVDTSKADGALYQQAKKFSAALDNEIKFWDKQWQIANKKQSYLDAINRAQKQADVIMKISAPIAGIGAAITAPLLTFANAYLQSAGKTEIAGQRYQDAMYKFQTAEIRVGRQVTEALVPALEQAADLAEKISKYAEDHPEVVQGLLGLGAGASVIGTVGLSIGLLTKSIADIASLAAKLGLGAADGIGAATVGEGAAVAGGTGVAAAAIVPVVVSVLSLLTGAGIGKYIGDVVNQGTLTPQEDDIGTELLELLTNAKLVASAAVGGVGKLLGQNNEWAIAAERFFGLLNDNVPVVNSAATGAQTLKDRLAELDDAFKNSPKHDEIVSAFKSYHDSLDKALSDFNKSVIETQSQFTAAVAQENASYDKSVASAYSSYQQSSAQAEEQYLAQRAQAQADFNKEMQRMAEDHNKKLRDLEVSHDDRLNSLAADRDALGIAQENNAYAKAVADENENYATEKKRREQDFADQLKQMDENYAAQKQQRDAALADQLAQLDSNHQEALTKLQQGENEKLAALDKSYKAQVAALQTGFVDRVRELDGRLLADYADYQSGLRQLAEDFSAWLTEFNQNATDGWAEAPGTGGGGYTPAPAIPQAMGGYTIGDRLYRRGEKGEEFVMRNDTTRLAERLIGGGRLTQDRILDALAMSSSSNSTNIRIAGRGMTMEQSRSIAQEAVIDNYDVLAKALG